MFYQIGIKLAIALLRHIWLTRYERTVVPRVESDAYKEMPLINPSCQDLVFIIALKFTALGGIEGGGR